MAVKNANASLDLLAGAGETGRLIAAHDWASTLLGPPSAWPAVLVDAVRIVALSRMPMYVVWGPELTLLYNDAYARILCDRHPDALGRSMRDVWPEEWHLIEPGIASALAGRPTFEEDRPRDLNRGGEEGTTYFTYAKVPLYDDAGVVRGVFCTCQETTSDVRARNAYQAQNARLLHLFHQAPGFMAVWRGPEHVYEIVNDAYVRLVGPRELIGKPVRTAFPELVGQPFFDLLDEVYRTGAPHVARRMPIRLASGSDGTIEERIINFVYQPIRDADGKVAGIFMEGTDVTELARADDLVRQSERLARDTIDALSEHIAVIDEGGRIVAVNAAWRSFASANVAQPSTVTEGANYLASCDAAAARGDRDAAIVAGLIREVAAGTREQAEWEYGCHLPDEERWFLLRITRFSDVEPARIVLSRENITERRKSDARIEYLATHDALTDLPNRNLLADRAEQLIEHSQRTGLGLSLLFIDLDNFKYLNDAYGHVVGDRVLQSVAAELKALLRAGDTIARLGGDEFVVLLADLTDATLDSSAVARGILQRFASALPLDDREITVTASIGISVHPTDGTTLDELLKHADAAMYRAKGAGRSGYQFYSADMSARANERVIIESELRRALRLDQFEVHYQPQVDLGGQAIVGMEALVRWRHPELGEVSPGRFIPIAEESGLINLIGRSVLRTACTQVRSWQRAGLETVPVAVNISAAQLRHPDFVGTVDDVLLETGIDPSLLELEITESIMMDRTEVVISRLNELKDLGVVLAIDDLGTGYSSLAYLKAFPLDLLKIDRSFVSGLPGDPNAAAIARAIVALGHSLGLTVLAEGVETEEQARFLRHLGCERAQGFLYSKALPADEAAKWLGRMPEERASLWSAARA